MCNLLPHHSRVDVERACEQVLRLPTPSYQAIRRILHRQAGDRAAPAATARRLQQRGPHIRDIGEYRAFWDEYCAMFGGTDLYNP